MMIGPARIGMTLKVNVDASALWPDLSFPPPGSPAYVRRLRDQAAVAALGGMLANPDLDRFQFGRDGQNPGDVAVKEANETVRALGYPVPENGGTP